MAEGVRDCAPFLERVKDYGTSHRIHEEILDAEVLKFATVYRQRLAEEQVQLKHLQKMWALRKPVLDAHISRLEQTIHKNETE